MTNAAVITTAMADTLSAARSSVAPLRHRLSGTPLQDTLQFEADTTSTVSGLSDSIPSGMLDSIPEPALRQVQAAEVFGPHSFMPDGVVHALPENVYLADNLPLQIATLCLLLLYTYIIFRYRRDIGQLFSIIFSSRKERSRSTDDYNYVFSDFMTGLLAVGYFMQGIVAVKITWLLANDDTLSQTGYYVPLLIIVAVAMTLVAMSIVQQLVLRVAGVLTLSIAFTRRLLALRRLFFLAAIALATPVALLLALSEGDAVPILVYIFAGVAAVMLIYYIYRSLRLFIEEKVSILLWMLYLCTVEVMPPVMILLAILRSI